VALTLCALGGSERRSRRRTGVAKAAPSATRVAGSRPRGRGTRRLRRCRPRRRPRGRRLQGCHAGV